MKRQALIWTFCLAFGFAPALPAQTAQAGEPAASSQVYIIQQGDTCLGVVRALDGRISLSELHRLNPELGESTPHRLIPGRTLRLSEAVSPDAHLTFVRPRVQTRSPEVELWTVGRQGQELFRQHRVSTMAGARTEVTFSDESQVLLNENSLLVVYGPSRRSSERFSASATLERGSLRGGLAALRGGSSVSESSLQLNTPGSEVTVDAQELRLDVDAQETSLLAVYKGNAAIRAQGRTVRVPQGNGTVAKKGQAPEPARPLPLAPQWQDPSHHTFLAINELPAEVVLRWQPVKNSSSFEVELANDSSFKDVFHQQKTGPETELRVGVPIPLGVYFARVSAIDKAGLTGSASPTLSFALLKVSVARASPNSAGALEAVHQTEVRLEGAPATGRLEVQGVEQPAGVAQLEGAGRFRVKITPALAGAGGISFPVELTEPELEVTRSPEKLPASGGSVELVVRARNASGALVALQPEWVSLSVIDRSVLSLSVVDLPAQKPLELKARPDGTLEATLFVPASKEAQSLPILVSWHKASPRATGIQIEQAAPPAPGTVLRYLLAGAGAGATFSSSDGSPGRLAGVELGAGIESRGHLVEMLAFGELVWRSERPRGWRLGLALNKRILRSERLSAHLGAGALVCAGCEPGSAESRSLPALHALGGADLKLGPGELTAQLRIQTLIGSSTPQHELQGSLGYRFFLPQ